MERGAKHRFGFLRRDARPNLTRLPGVIERVLNRNDADEEKACPAKRAKAAKEKGVRRPGTESPFGDRGVQPQAFVEFRGEDPAVPIKLLHKMTEAQVKKEMSGLPLEWVETIGVLPRQHIIVFRKSP